MNLWTRKYFRLLHSKLRKIYGKPIGAGRHRIVYRLNKNWVLKVPSAESGVFANYTEDKAYLEDPTRAKALLSPTLSRRYDIPIIKMEYVVHRGWSPRADWTWSVDCGQVGTTRDGRLVAYDWEHY